MTLADPRLHHDAIIAALESAGLVVGDGTYPEVDYGWQGTPGESTFLPYALLYPLTQTFDGSLGCPDVDADLGWQVTCVGSTRRQCDGIENAVNIALIGTQRLIVAGRSLPRLYRDGGAGPRRDDSVQPPTFISTPQFAVMSVEA